MSVIIPSDLIVDVMNAVDPRRVHLAMSKLGAPPSGRVAQNPLPFADILSRLAHRPIPPKDLIVEVMDAADPTKREAADQRLADLSPKAPDAYAQYEGFMLRDAFESMLPNSESSAFGDGFAGSVWRSMAAEQFASIFTERGGLGIAEMLRKQDEGGAHVATQWPYYRATSILAYMPPSQS